MMESDQSREKTPVEKSSIPTLGMPMIPSNKSTMAGFNRVLPHARIARVAADARDAISGHLSQMGVPWSHISILQSIESEVDTLVISVQHPVEPSSMSVGFEPIRKIFSPCEIDIVLLHNPISRGMGSFDSFEGSLVNDKVYGPIPGIGTSIGCSGVAYSSGTDGGYIYITKDGHRDLFLLSGHHVIFPGGTEDENEKFKKLEREISHVETWVYGQGRMLFEQEKSRFDSQDMPSDIKCVTKASSIHPWSIDQYHTIMMPSDADHMSYIYNNCRSANLREKHILRKKDLYGDEAKIGSEKRLQELYMRLANTASTTDRRLGKACFGSGIGAQPENGTTFDAGLTQIYKSHQTRCVNYIHPVGHVKLTSFRELLEDGLTITSYADPVPEEAAAYIGRKSGLVFGRILSPGDPLSIRCKIPGNGFETDEWVFQCHYMTPRVYDGDTGAWIFNLKGQVVGRIFAFQQKSDLRFFTPFSTDVKRIEAATGGSVTLPSLEEATEQLKCSGIFD